jgi:hypothetical protein
MQLSKMPIVLPTHRPWITRLLDGVIDRWLAWRDGRRRRAQHRHDRLHALDARMLSDLGLDRSELSSVDAEARHEAALTRRRIAVLADRHA